MKLLDFPPEIFKHVIHCLVSDAGVAGSWKLRGVCRTFDQEISENVLAIQPKEAFDDDRDRHLLLRPGNLKYYIAYHVKNPRDVFPELPAKIQQMLD
ncbi:uncharacterized protein ALTATR162_LOCUS9619 [Alternaria atra]|uniref:F-box domain-containing protein n=1 Tax=Alternaria atra TaxID=119953 RepID=A0A8J2I7A1_9PLEO|nr:uncharacterized protein ALTATR162_LOCUS9619 [Alternaria atra]CAG5181152.1 unnamed protein product [Alternaria atra]